MARSDQQFSSQDLERLARETFVTCVDYHRELGSTNDRALQLVTAGQVHEPTLVLAEHQRAGRGRGTNGPIDLRGAGAGSCKESQEEEDHQGSAVAHRRFQPDERPAYS